MRTNQDQFVIFNDVKSDVRLITTGVPQGSILGSLLFLLYINDICKSSTYLTFILYADDTNICFSSANVSDTCEIINRELKNVMQWFITNRLSVNLKKTRFMGFGAKAHSSFGSNKISLNGVDIAKVNHAKFLGVLLDYKLTCSLKAI